MRWGGVSTVPSSAFRLVSSVTHSDLTTSWGLNKDGDYLYVTNSDDDRFNTVDVSDVDNPTVVASLQDVVLLDGPRNIARLGNKCYVQSSDYITEVDVTNPLVPFISATLDLGNSHSAVASVMNGNYLYACGVSAASLRSLFVIDVSTFTVVGSVNHTTNLNSVGYMSYHGGYCYCSMGTGRFTIVNVSTPTAPTISGTYNNLAINAPRMSYVDGDGYAYLATSAKGLAIMNVSNPASISLAGTWNPDAPTSPLSLGLVTAVKSGNIVFTSSGAYSNFTAVDVSNPAAPVTSASLADSEFGSTIEMFMEGDFIYATNVSGDRVYIVEYVL